MCSEIVRASSALTFKKMPTIFVKIVFMVHFNVLYQKSNILCFLNKKC